MPIRTPVNRGFKNPRNVRYVAPTVRKNPYAGGQSLAGAPGIGRRQTVRKAQPYPNPPATWLGPIGEWIIYWYLTTRKHMVEGQPGNFYYQSAVRAPFLFSSRDFTRVDFLVDLGPQAIAGQIGHYVAIGFDPITAFTHPDPAFDKRRREELDEAGYLLIFMETYMLQLNPTDIIEKGLRGQDVSSRA